MAYKSRCRLYRLWVGVAGVTEDEGRVPGTGGDDDLLSFLSFSSLFFPVPSAAPLSPDALTFSFFCASLASHSALTRAISSLLTSFGVLGSTISVAKP